MGGDLTKFQFPFFPSCIFLHAKLQNTFQPVGVFPSAEFVYHKYSKNIIQVQPNTCRSPKRLLHYSINYGILFEVIGNSRVEKCKK